MFECLLKERHIEIAAAEHDRDRLAHAVAVLVDELSCDVVEWHLDGGRYMGQSVHEDLVVVWKVVDQHVVSFRKPCLVVEVLQDRVGLDGHSLRHLDVLGLSVLVLDSDDILRRNIAKSHGRNGHQDIPFFLHHYIQYVFGAYS